MKHLIRYYQKKLRGVNLFIKKIRILMKSAVSALLTVKFLLAV